MSARNADSVRCANCGEVIVQETDDPCFHDDSGEERCWPDRDEWATPAQSDGSGATDSGVDRSPGSD